MVITRSKSNDAKTSLSKSLVYTKHKQSKSKSKNNLLSFFTRSKSFHEDEKLYNLSIGELKILISCFPDFPQKMLVYLIQKHYGNCFEVYEYLIQNGWNSVCKNKHKILTNSNAQQFVIPYYHGERSHSVLTLMLNADKGSYLTYYKYANKKMYYYAYYIVYKNNSGDIIHKQIDSPKVPLSLKSELNLQYPICSPIERRISYIPGAIEILEHIKNLK